MNEINNPDYENSSPININYFTDIINGSYSKNVIENTFLLFHLNINNISYLLYSSINKSIICYNLNEEQITAEIKNPHENEYISSLGHCYDEKNKKDIIMSISAENNNIKLWSFINWNCILNIKNVYKEGCLYSACFLNEIKLNQKYIIISNGFWFDVIFGPIKIYNLNGNIIKKIPNSEENTCFINVYYNKNKKYIITGNYGKVKSYDYDENSLYNIYNNEEADGYHRNVVVIQSDDIIKLLESCDEGFIKIWNFDTAELLGKISDPGKNLRGICEWDENYFFVKCKNGNIKLLNLEKKSFVNLLTGHNNPISFIQKVRHPKYGNCLVSQGIEIGPIKLWINTKKFC